MIFDRIFTSHMVFAAHKPIRLYGEGEGSAVVDFAGMTRSVVSQNGKWYAEFPAMEYGGPLTLKLTSSENEIILDDIYVGEVYLLSGQSNIEFKLVESSTPKENYLPCDMLRYYAVDKITTGSPFSSSDGWFKATEENVGNWSAIGYLCGFEMAEKKGCAIGLINCNQGASVIESWVPEGTFEKLGINIPLEKKRINHTYEPYQKFNADGKLYNYQLTQVFPFSISGVVWYQGEADSFGEEADLYGIELSALIDVWRGDFKDPNLDFYIIQIADYIHAKDPIAWKKVQAIQLELSKTKNNVKTVICADVCETDEIHPPTKDKLAKRLTEAIMSE